MHLFKRMIVLSAATLGSVAMASAAGLPGAPAATTHHPAASQAVMPLWQVRQISPAIREVAYANPPLNLIEPRTLVELNALVTTLSADAQVKVVIFKSTTPGFFINHFDTSQFAGFASQTGAASKPLWVELISNLQKAPFISIAQIDGRTQGGGNELTLAMDLRYASTDAVFDQPEVGLGLFPGGGGPDHLVRLAGRDRTLEVFLSSDDYDAATAERFGWVTRALPAAALQPFVSTLAARIASFDKTALVETKRHIDAIALPTEAERLAANQAFLGSLSWPGLSARMPVFGKLIQEAGPATVESRMGYYIGEGNRRLQDGTNK
ncbi:enoyl-CoA hydratase/isomerase family protein [Xanthomonas dyei]|uniref:enoyl-CoA hydratase/isomerase family protein n=1 Tax=Xanthomonas dyei TaxID=743699 RepID=UPI001E42E32A|nr:enoyl-CoA hydratase/isomerase family protein [Xanthomonas dyei pv. eucalypti]